MYDHVIPFTLVSVQIKTGRLAAVHAVDSAQTLSTLAKSPEDKQLASGLNIKPVKFRFLPIAAGVCGMVDGWLFLPGLSVLVIGDIDFYIPSGSGRRCHAYVHG
ncbi:MAG: hypothetical protein JEZ00_11450 [Anaerolineaceae bacterium]|nr:hypothetical protein [Anaerolineaceae bacterium]